MAMDVAASRGIAVGLIAYYIYRPCAVLGLARSVPAQVTVGPHIGKKKLTQRTPRAPIISCSAGRVTEDGGMWYPDNEECRHKKRRNEGNRCKGKGNRK